MRTVSNCFDRPFWGTCTQTGNIRCVMPNSRCTPDSVIAVVPQNSMCDLRYPIFICEVLGKKKSQGTNEEKFDGFNACMQSLVFAPRAYYCEIIDSDARLRMLKKVPHKGTLSCETITYRLYVEDDFKRLVKDICRALVDCMVQLTPIAEYSSKCLRDANHRDFLNVPSTHSTKIEPHCWHIFVPSFLNQDRAEVPGDYLSGVDWEDPAMPDPDPDLPEDYIVRFDQLVSDALPVDETNIDLDAITNLDERLDMSVIRAVRDEDGRPVAYDDIQSAMEAASVNFGAEAGINRMKNFIKRYRPSGIGFLEGDDPRRRSIIDVSTAENPMKDTIESAYDIEFDGDDTIISGGGSLRQNVIVFDSEDNIKIVRRARCLPAPRKRCKIRVTMGERDMEIMSAAARNILQRHQEPGEPDDVPPLEGDPDVPPPGGDPPAPGPGGESLQGAGQGARRPTKGRRETRALDPNAIIATKLRSHDRR